MEVDSRNRCVDPGIDNRNRSAGGSEVIEENLSLICAKCHRDAIALEGDRSEWVFSQRVLDHSSLLDIVERVSTV